MSEVEPTPKQVAEEIVKRVQSHDYVSMGEMINIFGDAMRGEQCICAGSDSNLVLFVGCSELFCEAVRIVIEEKPPRALFYPTSMLVMACDGCPMPTTMPFAKRPPKGGYKKAHFCPTLFARPESVDREIRGVQKK